MEVYGQGLYLDPFFHAEEGGLLAPFGRLKNRGFFGGSCCGSESVVERTQLECQLLVNAWPSHSRGNRLSYFWGEHPVDLAG